MKRNLCLLLSFTLCFLFAGNMNAQKFSTVPLSKDFAAMRAKSIKAHSSPTHKSIIHGKGLIYYEDFEKVAGDEENNYPVPEGWKSTATPGYDKDIWHCGHVSTGNNLLNGHSGYSMLYILCQMNAHDAWAFSPKFKLEGGKHYTISYYILMVGEKDVYEDLTGWIGDGQSKDSMMVSMDHHDTDTENWERVDFDFTPTTSGSYCLGFNSKSPALGNGTFVDDIQVTTGPVLYSDDVMTFPAKYDMATSQLQNYTIKNLGTKSFELSLKSLSPEVTVDGLPTIVPANGSVDLPVTLSVNKAGDYVGNFCLNTTDTTISSLNVEVDEKVLESRITGYWLENFTDGLPKGWINNGFYFYGNGGIDNSNAICCDTYIDNELTSHFTEMGKSPKLKFYYKAYVNDASGAGDTPEAADIEFKVQLSDDGGASYKDIYVVSADGNAYVPSKEFAEVNVDLAEYANKTCLLRFSVPNKVVQMWKDILYYFDDVSMGTKLDKDLEAVTLRGNSIINQDKESTYKFTVRNRGIETQKDYTVRLMQADGTEIASAPGVEVANNQTCTIDLNWKPSKSYATKVYAEVVLNNDELESNNKSSVLPVSITPAATWDVSGEKTDSVYDLPFDFYHNGSATQSIYTANEIGRTGGTIYGLKYYSNSNADFDSSPVQIWVGETDKANFNDGKWIDVKNLTKVYDNTIFIPANDGTVDIPFDEPFEYKGGNLVVYTVKKSPFFISYRLFYRSPILPDVRTIEVYSRDTTKINVDSPSTSDCTFASFHTTPSLTFIMNDYDKSILTGTIKDYDEKVLPNAKVRIDGTQLYAMTDKDGKYLFNNIDNNDYVIDVSCHGYYDNNNTFAEVYDKEVNVDVYMRNLPKYAITGQITDALTGNNVKGATIRLQGYDKYTSVTDNDGNYNIKDVFGEEGYKYRVIVTSPYYKTLVYDSILVNADKQNINYSLKEQTNPVRNVSASKNGNDAVVKWADVMPEFRHDTGIPNGTQRGFVTCDNFATAIVGTVFRNNAVIHDIRWYTTDEGGVHKNVNIIIFDLDKNGEPTYDILDKEIAPNTDSQWNTYTLPDPVDAPNGFFLAMSYSNGYLGLSESTPTEEYPLTKGMEYYNSDYTSTYKFFINYNDLGKITGNHLMLRAVGDDYGVLDNEYATDRTLDSKEKKQVRANEASSKVVPTDYTVYRLTPGQEQSEWTVVADHVKGNIFTDVNIDKLSQAEYEYAVIANYGDEKSDYRLSNTIDVADDIENIESTDVNSEDNNVYSIDGKLVSKEGQKCLKKGIYIVNGKKITIK